MSRDLVHNCEFNYVGRYAIRRTITIVSRGQTLLAQALID